MRTVHPAAHQKATIQFGLMELMEFVTICAILFALSGATGIAASIFLALTALAFAMQRGLFVLLMLASASVAADLPAAASDDNGLLRQITVILIGMSLCAWFRLRGVWQNSASRISADSARHL
jgi:hypothetical protein